MWSIEVAHAFSHYGLYRFVVSGMHCPWQRVLQTEHVSQCCTTVACLRWSVRCRATLANFKLLVLYGTDSGRMSKLLTVNPNNNPVTLRRHVGRIHSRCNRSTKKERAPGSPAALVQLEQLEITTITVLGKCLVSVEKCVWIKYGDSKKRLSIVVSGWCG